MSPSELLFEPENHKDLSGLNTLGFLVYADYFCRPESEKACQEALGWARKRDLPVFPLGSGSNLILAADIPGLVVQMSNQQRHYDPQADGSVLLTVGAGVVWHDLVMETVGKGLYGLENLALIPGRTGAAPVQNIGAYGSELADVLVSVSAIRVCDGKPVTLSREACFFGYRDSIFKSAEYQQGRTDQVIITSLLLRLQTKAEPKLGYGDLAAELEGKEVTPLRIARAVCRIRQSKLPDPAEVGNAGSFFKNPVVSSELAQSLKGQYPGMPVYPAGEGQNKLAAGWLIEQCGFKGTRRGSVGVYPKQALVLVHYGGGSAEGLLALADDIVSEVKHRFQVELEREPQVIL
ncbi:UDP-N-acetylmuramate dehydrogenase [Oceanospirillum linum]|uniref:UDP-N-acetylmuramate dehydrogenase n=1 Tax=Oceanospirillum linum TaxID=966 RepID=UPI00089EDB1C|nr:UDP-N-acetylmuramate dehydrogenase [Oceanospirillum linum]SEF50202.1 UDP-N-acetylmuramate dehydrogenase [Oleiphilus messinensis]SMP03777.1 UDP-N-acetylmuramate dehydrogenase [Oceanospirillum linum]